MKIVNLVTFKNKFLALGRTQSKIASLDVGKKQIGVAIADETKRSITPFGVLNRKEPRMEDDSILKLSGQLQSFVTANNVGGFVIGFPLLESGELTPFCREIINLVSRIECNYGLANNSEGVSNPALCTFWDERYSTIAAKSMAKAHSGRRSVVMKHKDTYAACVILQNMINDP